MLVLGLLAVTYLAWVAGLRANVDANWCLLEQTGTSTNALSKVGFELARLRSTRQRVARVASAIGYVVTEVAKEAPYYAGAFGTTLLSDSVDSTDALAFLAGTNVGAAIYEYGVAHLTRTYLHKRSRHAQWAREGSQGNDSTCLRDRPNVLTSRLFGNTTPEPGADPTPGCAERRPTDRFKVPSKSAAR